MEGPAVNMQLSFFFVNMQDGCVRIATAAPGNVPGWFTMRIPTQSCRRQHTGYTRRGHPSCEPSTRPMLFTVVVGEYAAMHCSRRVRLYRGRAGARERVECRCAVSRARTIELRSEGPGGRWAGIQPAATDAWTQGLRAEKPGRSLYVAAPQRTHRRWVLHTTCFVDACSMHVNHRRQARAGRVRKEPAAAAPAARGGRSSHRTRPQPARPRRRRPRAQGAALLERGRSQAPVRQSAATAY